MIAVEYRVIGWIAAGISIVNLLPQAIHAVLNQSVRGLSSVSIFAFLFGNISWIFYGLIVHAYPVLIAASVKMIAVCIFLWFKFQKGAPKYCF